MEKNLVLLYKMLVIGIIILFIGICANPSIGAILERKSNTAITNGNTLYVGGTGEGNYTFIQDAIDDASDGDSILVYSGIYKENVLINKRLTLKGIVIEDIPVIDGCNIDDVVTIFADNCIFEGFQVINSSEENWTYSGIYVISNNNTLQNNKISYNENGIFVENSYNNTIYGNNFCWNSIGIYLAESCENNISDNTFSNNTLGILAISHSNNNDFLNNIIDGNGFQISQSSYNEIKMNSITNYSNVYLASALGITLYLSHNNLINENTIDNYEFWGICLEKSRNNIITRNNILHNGLFGVYLGGLTRKNIIKQNNFLLNGYIEDIPFIKPNNAFFSNCYFNQWDENYWDDWSYKIPRPIKGRLGILQLIPVYNFDWHPAQKPYDI